MKPRRCTLEEYLSGLGLGSGDYPNEPGLMSPSSHVGKNAISAHMKRTCVEFNKWLTKKKNAEKEFERLVSAGQIVVPDRWEQIIRTLCESKSVAQRQASARLLAKYHISQIRNCWECPDRICPENLPRIRHFCEQTGIEIDPEIGKYEVAAGCPRRIPR